MKKIWILARMTFREAIRRRIVLTGLVLGILFLIVFSVGFRMILRSISSGECRRERRHGPSIPDEMSNFLLLAGLYAVAFLSVAMGALLSADTLAGEISSGTIQTIVTKPLRRSDVVIGQMAGVCRPAGAVFPVDVRGNGVERLSPVRISAATICWPVCR